MTLPAIFLGMGSFSTTYKDGLWHCVTHITLIILIKPTKEQQIEQVCF